MVPSAGTPKWRSLMVQADADAAADICGTRAINGAVKALCTAEPNSITALPSAARTMRFVFVRWRLWWLIESKTMVSTNCA